MSLEYIILVYYNMRRTVRGSTIQGDLPDVLIFIFFCNNEHIHTFFMDYIITYTVYTIRNKNEYFCTVYRYITILVPIYIYISTLILYLHSFLNKLCSQILILSLGVLNLCNYMIAI